MNRRDYDGQTKDAIIKRRLEGERAPVVVAEMKVPRSALYLWVKNITVVLTLPASQDSSSQ